MNTQTASALRLLGLEVPTTLNALRTAYRRCAKLEHPDYSKHPQANARFQAVQSAYVLLQNDTSILDVVETQVTHTEEGDELSKLGKGLGPTTNGLNCEDCKGLGYSGYASGRQCCLDCREIRMGRFEYRCWKCKGTGFFRTRSGHLGTCFNCNGTGWFAHRNKSPFHNSCTTCFGIGTVVSKKAKVYHTCYKCKGKGELPMWNPVLPKGFLGSVGVSR